MATKVKGIKINVIAEGSMDLDEYTGADINIAGTIIVKPSYMRALKVCSRLTDYIDYSKYQTKMVHIADDTIDDLKLLDVDADTEAKVKSILHKTVDIFGSMFVMPGDINYSAALVNRESIFDCEENLDGEKPDSCYVYDHTGVWGLQLMAVAFAGSSEECTDLDMIADVGVKSYAYHVLGNGIFEASEDIQYNLSDWE